MPTQSKPNNSSARNQHAPSMRPEDVEQQILAVAFAMIRAKGVAVDCMEPMVVMAKLRRVYQGRGVETISWMGSPLLEVRRQRQPDGTHWALHDSQGVLLWEAITGEPPH